MCGIVGVIDPEGASAETLAAMAAAIRHRGPDDEGFFTAGEAGLGMRRLSIIDLAGGHQPMSNERRTLQVVQNGEIYNYRELFAELGARGHVFHSQSDTETIVHAYEEYGDGCVERLWGMFAIAVWDGERRRLLVARDRLGKKPLFWAEREGRFAFASELKSLAALDWIDTTPDDEAIAQYLAAGFIASPRSIFRGVRKLAPGEAGVFESGRFRRWRYWEPHAGEARPATKAQVVARAGALLADAVERRLLSDVPVGALLSSGIDSSVVAALALRAKPDLDTFTVGFHEADLDESRDAEALAAALGTRHHTLVADAQLPAIVEDVVWHLDEPLVDPAAIPTYLIAREARRHVTVVLTGEGADEVFAGYPWYTWEAGATRVRTLLHPFGGRAAAGTLKRAFGKLGLRKPSRFFDGTEAPEGAGLPYWVRILHDDLCLRPPAGSEWTAYTDAWSRVAPGPDLRNRLLELDQRTFLPDDLLMKVDRMTMAHSLEARTPYLDHRLIELMAAVPSSWKFRWRGPTKPLLREIARTLLPAETLARRKRVFATPLARWLVTDLRPLVEDVCAARHSASGWLDLRVLGEAYRRLRAGAAHLDRMVWSGVVLETWHAQWRTRARPVPLGAAGRR